MCAVAYTTNGTLISAPKGDFESDPSFQLVHRDGRPDFFVERSATDMATKTELNGSNGTHMNNGVNGTNGTNGNPTTSKTACMHCGMTTHPDARCYKKFPHLAPKRLQERLASSSTTTTTTYTNPPSTTEAIMAGA